MRWTHGKTIAKDTDEEAIRGFGLVEGQREHEGEPKVTGESSNSSLVKKTGGSQARYFKPVGEADWKGKGQQLDNCLIITEADPISCCLNTALTSTDLSSGLTLTARKEMDSVAKSDWPLGVLGDASEPGHLLQDQVLDPWESVGDGGLAIEQEVVGPGDLLKNSEHDVTNQDVVGLAGDDQLPKVKGKKKSAPNIRVCEANPANLEVHFRRSLSLEELCLLEDLKNLCSGLWLSLSCGFCCSIVA
ncbi:hypothetical protein GUJ93_ZPchr0013g34289 [Zizania palustris]|uniref:Uncharacterized protein n=1 Tax=Zizania palustris TaxID=103762 RepID=A0A8J5WWN6_ZIZPA|nr:hypothetical protein GUJ93_ZPchr0013g34289 [Zizania palustris]